MQKTLTDDLDHFNDNYDMWVPHLMTGLFFKRLPPRNNSPSPPRSRENRRCALDVGEVQPPPQVLALMVVGIQGLHQSKQRWRPTARTCAAARSTGSSSGMAAREQQQRSKQQRRGGAEAATATRRRASGSSIGASSNIVAARKRQQQRPTVTPG